MSDRDRRVSPAQAIPAEPMSWSSSNFDLIAESLSLVLQIDEALLRKIRKGVLMPTGNSPRQRAAVPYGGAAEVARLDLRIHTRNTWTGRCRACRERFPCPTRRQALAALAVMGEC